MPYFTLHQDNRAALAHSLSNSQQVSGSDNWLVVCLCAEWCNTCKSYQTPFRELAAQYPAIHFVYLDIEDHADLLGDLDIENFPTLLIQKGEETAFFGTTLPEIALAQRLLDVQLQTDAAQISRQDQAISMRADLQELHRLLHQAENSAS